MMIPHLVVYYHAGCNRCEDARSVLERVKPHHPFVLEEVDLDSDPVARALHDEQAPVVTVQGQVVFRHQVDEDRLIRRVKQAVADLELEAELAARQRARQG